jgi:hypothetical protein
VANPSKNPLNSLPKIRVVTGKLANFNTTNPSETPLLPQDIITMPIDRRKFLFRLFPFPFKSPGFFVSLFSFYSSVVSLCLNFREARSVERNRKWFPCNSNSKCTRSRTVSAALKCDDKELPPSDSVPVEASVEYSGTAKANIEFCFGITKKKFLSAQPAGYETEQSPD